MTPPTWSSSRPTPDARSACCRRWMSPAPSTATDSDDSGVCCRQRARQGGRSRLLGRDTDPHVYDRGAAGTHEHRVAVELRDRRVIGREGADTPEHVLE